MHHSLAKRRNTVGPGNAGYRIVVGPIGRRCHRVVQQVGSQHIPCLVDGTLIFGDENRCGSTRNGKLNDSGLVSVGTALRFVELLQTRQRGLGNKPNPVTAGTSSGGLAATGDQHHRPVG
jgi:hypothetical protein